MGRKSTPQSRVSRERRLEKGLGGLPEEGALDDWVLGGKEVRERLELGHGAERIEVAEVCESDRWDSAEDWSMGSGEWVHGNT